MLLLFFRFLRGRSRSGLLITTVCLAACEPAFEQLPDARSARGSLGAEVYKLLCRRVAGTELPDDLDGRTSSALCLGDDQTAQAALARDRERLPAALVALADRRSSLIVSVDQLMPAPLGTDLDLLFRGLIPYYGDPDPRVPNASRALAAWLAGPLQEPAVASALARELRDGMVPRGVDNGLFRALGNIPDLSKDLAALLPALLDGAVAPAFAALRISAALELGTLPAEDGTPDAVEQLFARRDDDQPTSFGIGGALATAKRDARGLPMPALVDDRVPYPFVDGDSDRSADVSGDRFLLDASFTGVLPEPYPVPGETGLARTADGRACALARDSAPDCSRALYLYTEERDGSLMAGLLPEVGRAFRGDAPLSASVLALAPALFGESEPRNAQYRSFQLVYDAPRERDQPLLDVMHALGAGQASAGYDDAMSAFALLLDDARRPFAAAIAPWLEMLRRTNPGADAYPAATLAPGNVFWDQLLWEAERLARRRLVAGGESALEGMLYAMLGYTRPIDSPQAPPVATLPAQALSHAGALLALALRYRDEWRPNPQIELRRPKDDPAVLGGFVTPVDRAQPDLPASCGKDGCGGPIVGSPFERFRLPEQQCVIEHDDQRGQGTDCGAPGNQSILQRTFGLMVEGYGRGQCNRPLSIADLVEEALGDPCKALEPETSCASDLDCKPLDPSSSDYVCDPAKRVCALSPSSARCIALKQQRDDDRGTLVFFAEQAIALDYVCPNDDPGAPCHAFEAEYPAAFIDPDGQGPLSATARGCDLMNIRDVGRAFGRTLTGDYAFEIPNPWVRRFLEDIARAGPVSASDDTNAVPDCDLSYRMRDPRVVPACIPGAARVTRELYDDIPPEVDTLGELMEFLVGDTQLFREGADTDALRPDVSVLARVLFAAGPAEGVQLFEPLLLRGAPAPCGSASGGLPACALSGDPRPPGGCCIADATRPPIQYRLDTYFGSTTFALEQQVRFRDGTQLSLLDVTRPIAAVFNRLDVDPATPPPRPDVEDLDYGLVRIGKLVGEHYDGAAAPTQSRDPNGFWYRRQTGLVTYEPLLADLLDDGSVEKGQTGPGGAPLIAPAPVAESTLGAYAGLFAVLTELERAPSERGGNMLDALARSSTLFLNPHRHCAGDAGDDRVLSGSGACDSLTPARARLVRRDGRDYPCWNDGRCFDSATPSGPRRSLSPLLLARDAVGDVLTRALSDPRTRRALHDSAERGGAFFFESDAAGFRQPRAVALLRVLVRHLRAQWAAASAEGTLESKAARDLTELSDTLREPMGAGAVQFARALGDDATLGLSRLLASALDESTSRAVTASVSDLLELSHAEAVTRDAAGAIGGLLVGNLRELLEGSASRPELAGSSLEAQLRVAQVLTAADAGEALARFAHNLTATNSATGASPLDAITDALLAVHRVEPGTRATFDASDVSRVAQSVSALLTDERRGLARLIAVVRCAASEVKPAHCSE